MNQRERETKMGIPFNPCLDCSASANIINHSARKILGKEERDERSKKWHLNKFSLVKISITSGRFFFFFFLWNGLSFENSSTRTGREENKRCENTTSTSSWATVFFSLRFILIPSFRGPPFVSFLLFATWKTKREREREGEVFHP